MAVGRKVGRGGRRREGGPAGAGLVDRAAMRAWARDAGLTISERGPISAQVMRQYRAGRYHRLAWRQTPG
jgi:hypothetical protein